MDFRVTGCILAGGEAKRMGRLNKGAQTIHGTSLFDLIHSALAPQVDEIVVSANAYAEYFLGKGCRVVTDRRSGYLGPLSGIESVLLSDERIDWLFCCPVDTPFIPNNLVAMLLSAAKESGTKAVTPTVNGKREPLHSLIHASLLPTLTEFLNGGERSVGYFLRRCDPLLLSIEADEQAFANINTTEELNLFSGDSLHV